MNQILEYRIIDNIYDTPPNVLGKYTIEILRSVTEFLDKDSNLTVPQKNEIWSLIFGMRGLIVGNMNYRSDTISELNSTIEEVFSFLPSLGDEYQEFRLELYEAVVLIISCCVSKEIDCFKSDNPEIIIALQNARNRTRNRLGFESEIGQEA